MCQSGSFRWDLYYRLNTLVMVIPPLRDRPADILPLAEHFARLASELNRTKRRRLSREVKALLTRYRWPGNVRELRNVIERAVLIAQEERVTAEDLSERIRKEQRGGDPLGAVGDDLPIKEKLRRYEAELLLEALRAHDWNQTRTAESLGIPLRTLVYKMKTLGLKKKYGSG
jgi:DNA-binding NtrC family response regulator